MEFQEDEDEEVLNEVQLEQQKRELRQQLIYGSSKQKKSVGFDFAKEKKRSIRKPQKQQLTDSFNQMVSMDFNESQNQQQSELDLAESSEDASKYSLTEEDLQQKRELRSSSRTKARLGLGKTILAEVGEVRSQEKPKREKKSMKELLYRTDSDYRLLWDLFVIFLALYNSYSIPLQISFRPKAFETAPVVILDFIIDFCFLLDILIAFKTPYYDKFSGEEITSSKQIARQYLKGNFWIDFFSTVPFDAVGEWITGEKNWFLEMLAVLKLARVMRLSRIIGNLNVIDVIKQSLHLALLIFYVLLYLHLVACLWWYNVQFKETWIPVSRYNWQDQVIFDSKESFVDIYLQVFYSAVLLTTGNDVVPLTTWEVFLGTMLLISGMLVNAIVFGALVVSIQELNLKFSRSQQQIDLVQTAMKNLKLENNLQFKIIGYLKYQQQTADSQQEMQDYFKMISPTLKVKSTEFIFKKALMENEQVKNDLNLLRMILSTICLEFKEPEERIIQQGDSVITSKGLTGKFYFIGTGVCQVLVSDEKNKERFVRQLKKGDYFGEVGLLTQMRRTSSVEAQNYMTIGSIEAETFLKLVKMFPRFLFQMKENITKYQDRLRVYILSRLFYVKYLSNIDIDCLSQIASMSEIRNYDQGQFIYKEGTEVGEIIILLEGSLEISYERNGETFSIGYFKHPGTIFLQTALLQNTKQNYSIVSRKNCKLLLVTKETIMFNYTQFDELKERVRKFIKAFPEYVTIDYQFNFSSTEFIIMGRKNKAHARWLLARKVLHSIRIKNHVRLKNSHFAKLTNGSLVKEIKELQQKEDEYQECAQTVLQQTISKTCEEKIKKLKDVLSFSKAHLRKIEKELSFEEPLKKKRGSRANQQSQKLGVPNQTMFSQKSILKQQTPIRVNTVQQETISLKKSTFAKSNQNSFSYLQRVASSQFKPLTVQIVEDPREDNIDELDKFVFDTSKSPQLSQKSPQHPQTFKYSINSNTLQHYKTSQEPLKYDNLQVVREIAVNQAIYDKHEEQMSRYSRVSHVNQVSQGISRMSLPQNHQRSSSFGSPTIQGYKERTRNQQAGPRPFGFTGSAISHNSDASSIAFLQSNMSLERKPIQKSFVREF